MRMHNKLARFLDITRLVLSVLGFGISLLALFKAPTALTWKLAILATEWGYLLTPITLLVFLPKWRGSLASRIAAGLGVLAAIFTLTPLVRAVPVAHQTVIALDRAFGAVPPSPTAGVPERATPLRLANFFPAVSPQPVPVSTLVYSWQNEEALTLDLYHPAKSAQPAPIVVVIHGGSWRNGNNQQFVALDKYLAGRGYAVAAINYRLAPRWKFPAARDDVQAAIGYLVANAEVLGLDKTRMVLLGRSAGGQLALQVAYTVREPGIRGVIAFYAPADLFYAYAHPGNPAVIDTWGILESYLGGSPAAVCDTYAAASPIRFVNASSPPTLLIHGVRDELVSIRQSERLDSRLAQTGVPHFLLKLPWATHVGDINFNGPSGQISTFVVERFLTTVMQR